MKLSRTIPTVLLASLMAITACAAPNAPAPAPSKNDAPKASSASSGPDAEWDKIVEAGKQEGKVLIYGALLGGPEGSAITEEFRKQTGITVDFVACAGSPLYSRIREELKGGGSADLFEGSQPWPSIIQKDGYFLSSKDKPLPVLRNELSAFPVDPRMMAEGGEYVISRFPSNVGHVIVNTKLLQPSEYPKSWKDIATEPRFTGKVGWVNPKSTGDVAYKWVQWGYNANAFSLEDVWSIYAKQSPLMMAVPMDVGGALGRGEAYVGATTGTIENLLEAGAPIKVILFPDVPVVEGVAGMGLVKDAPHPNAALVFMNWVLSQPGQQAITSIAKIRSMRKDVPSGSPPSVTPEVAGGGQRGPTYLMTGAQAELAGDLHAAGVFQTLPEGISQADFLKNVNTYLADWETKHGGPQKQQIKLEPW